MAKVIPFANEDIDSLLRRFKKKVEDEGILIDVQRHAYFEKPSIIRRRDKEYNTRRCIKERRKNER